MIFRICILHNSFSYVKQSEKENFAFSGPFYFKEGLSRVNVTKTMIIINSWAGDKLIQT